MQRNWSILLCKLPRSRFAQLCCWTFWNILVTKCLQRHFCIKCIFAPKGFLHSHHSFYQVKIIFIVMLIKRAKDHAPFGRLEHFAEHFVVQKCIFASHFAGKNAFLHHKMWCKIFTRMVLTLYNKKSDVFTGCIFRVLNILVYFVVQKCIFAQQNIPKCKRSLCKLGENLLY